MARARVELKGSVSYVIDGRVWKKRKPQILTNDGEIARYKAIGGFSVSMLDEESKPKPKAKATVVPPPPADDGDDGDDGMKSLVEAELKKMKKSALVIVGNDLGLDLDEDSKKSDLIEEILEAQEEAAEE